MLPSRRPLRVAAFTLVELLAVVSIISILTGLLVPAVVLARRASAQTACAANLRQWATAANLYALNYNGCLPRRGQGQQQTAVFNRPSDWFNALPAALREPTYESLVNANQMPRPGHFSGPAGLFICPSALDTPNGNKLLFTYAMNMRLSTWDSPTPDRIDHVGPTVSMVFMADGPGGYCSTLPFNYTPPAGPGLPISPAARHQGRVNVAFLDGHVANFTAAYVGCNLGDPQQPDLRWTVPSSSWKGPVQ